MSNQLSLDNIRSTLARLEETIIFGLIERAQFCENRITYERNGVGEQLGGESLLGFLLHECECSHTKVRRYTSPDEHPFYTDLPEPVLPPLSYDDPLVPNTININARIREAYEREIVPRICPPGDDRQWGSSAVSDVSLLQALSRRIHYGKFVAEAKYRNDPARFEPLVRRGDEAKLMDAITDRTVEDQVLDRVHHKASAYGQELGKNFRGSAVDPDAVRDIYANWIIPLNKEVQVRYLTIRPTGDR